jgi:hypothetical protein
MKEIFKTQEVRLSFTILLVFILSSLTVYVGASIFEGTFSINHFFPAVRGMSLLIDIVSTVIIVFF